MSTAKVRAKQTANYFLKGDDYIVEHERKFDNKWEQWDGDDVAREFRKLYYASEILQRTCQRSRYFGPAMIGEGINGYLTPTLSEVRE